MMMKNYQCLSVPGGWQTIQVTSVESSLDQQELVGPVFRKITDLWEWQRDNLYQHQQQ